ncbi:hypothetical protein [Streptomyces uncialis]|uniref:hypothetical protein n=1 Tax=Streptomyces uncialis TaxID=1048205 RepID=UPI0038649173|nr:hypothetical protein OG924_10010 [Streptomyces uncialis]
MQADHQEGAGLVEERDRGDLLVVPADEDLLHPLPWLNCSREDTADDQPRVTDGSHLH